MTLIGKEKPEKISSLFSFLIRMKKNNKSLNDKLSSQVFDAAIGSNVIKL
jgi:hypothetical protein